MNHRLILTAAQGRQRFLHRRLADLPTLRGTGQVAQDQGDDILLALGLHRHAVKIHVFEHRHVLRLGRGLHLQHFRHLCPCDRHRLHAAFLLPSHIHQRCPEPVRVAARTQALRDKLRAHRSVQVVAQHLAHQPGAFRVRAFHWRHAQIAGHQCGDAGGVATIHHRLREMHLVIGRAVEGLGIARLGVRLLAGAGFVLPPAFAGLLVGGHLLEKRGRIAAGGLHFIQRIFHPPVGKRLLRVDHGGEFSRFRHEGRGKAV